MRKRTNLVGQKFGRLLVVEDVGYIPSGRVLWRCHCDCGNICEVRADNLLVGKAKSCGCLKRENLSVLMTGNQRAIKHGHCTIDNKTKSPTYNSWRAMYDRCHYPQRHDYKHYGGRGITICERWNSFEAFLEDLGERPEGTSLDRIDPELGYFKANCRWADAKTQANNKRPRDKKCKEERPCKNE